MEMTLSTPSVPAAHAAPECSPRSWLTRGFFFWVFANPDVSISVLRLMLLSFVVSFFPCRKSRSRYLNPVVLVRVVVIGPFLNDDVPHARHVITAPL